MKSQKGMTMLSLVIYVASFLVVTGIIGAITTYFYNNMKIMDTSVGSSAEYNKLNVYFLKQTKTTGVSVYQYECSESAEDELGNDETTGNSNDQNEDYITFTMPDGNKNTFVKIGDILYFNKIKLCENVDKFKVEVDKSNKTVVKVYVVINNKAYSTEYVLN